MRRVFVGIGIICILSGSAVVQADSGKFYIGGEGGVGSLAGLFNPDFGGTLGFLVSPKLEIGATFLYNPLQSAGSSAGTIITATGNVYYRPSDKGFYVGGMIGYMSYSVALGSVYGSFTLNGIVFGADAGYDIALGKSLSFGPDLRAFLGSSGSFLPYLNGTLKIWF